MASLQLFPQEENLKQVRNSDRKLSQESVPMANEHTKRYLTSIIRRGKKIKGKTPTRYHVTITGRFIIFLKANSDEYDHRELESSYTG